MNDLMHTDIDNFYVSLDSRNATSYLNTTPSYNSHVKFDFEQSIMFSNRAIKKTCSVLQFWCPNSLFNINETNNILVIYFNLHTVSINIPYGNYDINTFMTQLITQIDSTFNISYNSLNYTLTITNTTYDFIIDGSQSTIYNVMGFLKNTNYLSSSKSLTLPYCVDFNGTQNINIYMNNLSTRNIDSYSKGTCSLLQSIPVDPNDAVISYINGNGDQKFTIYEDSFGFIEISIKDSLGNYINFNNQHWGLFLCFSVVRNLNQYDYKKTFYDILQSGYT